MNVILDPARCAVVLVDYQERLLPAIHGGAQLVAEAARLADCARELGIRVVGTEQNPQGLGPNVPEILRRCEATLAKMHFDGCADGLADALRVPGRPAPTDVVVAGCETHVCLMQTAHGLQRAGFKVVGRGQRLRDAVSRGPRARPRAAAPVRAPRSRAWR